MRDWRLEAGEVRGVRVATREMPQVQSVAIGVFVDAGSRDEPAKLAGISHALEHMAFKGTKSLDVHRLAERLDELGGQANAFTTRERTCFHLHVLHERWTEALELLLDMALAPSLPDEEWAREREVILAEMAMVEDSPEDWLMDRHLERVFGSHPLGRPVIGNEAALRSITRRDLMAFRSRFYRPPRLLVAAAGRIRHEEFVRALNDRDWPEPAEPVKRPPANPIPGLDRFAREGEQALFAISAQGVRAASDQRPVAWLANQVLGGGMSSRLFREVRERRGLAYHVGAHLASFTDTGLWTVTCQTPPALAPDAAGVIVGELDRLARDLNEAEVGRARDQLEVQMRMGMDSVEGQMLYLGALLDEDELRSPWEWIEAMRRVRAGEIREWIAGRWMDARWSVAAPEHSLSAICDRLPPC